MQSFKVDAFFSCSFSDDDAEVNEFFMAICRALDMRLSNVSTGSSLTPPAEAKKQIEAAQALIAVCTRRSELKAGGFVMPQAVHDEISFAFGKDIPILMVSEGGVDLAGFKSNFGTYLSFDRAQLSRPDFIQKAVSAIHQLKLEAVGDHELGAVQGISDAHAEHVHHLVELKPSGDDFVWAYSTTKKLVYSHSSKRGFPSGVWATVPPHVPEGASDLTWDYSLRSSSRGIKLVPSVEKRTASAIEVTLRLDPPAEEGDHIEYTTRSSSRYINPIWAEDAVDQSYVHLDKGDFSCVDGLILIHRTRKAYIEFRFDASYGFSKSDVLPLVASYTSGVDYEVPSELKRCDIRMEDFGGNLTVRIEVDSPLPGHIYGIAWNPKKKPAAL